MQQVQARESITSAKAHCRSLVAGSFFALVLLFALPCLAHPDLLAQIDSVSAEIKKNGQSADLYLQRADLFRRHAQFGEALADIDSARHLDTNTLAVALPRAHILIDANRASEALEDIQVVLKNQPGNVEAILIRARCNASLGHAEAAVADYNEGIAHSFDPSIDLFLARAKQQAALGKLEDAVHGLDDAITNSVGVSLLQLTAIEYDRRRRAFDSALARVDKILDAYPVKEPWLTLRAEVLEQAGRTQEAERSFQQVIEGLGQYSAVRRSLDLTKQLEARARAGLIRTQIKLQASSKQ
jgi:predicted Zn-dependent protease